MKLGLGLDLYRGATLEVPVGQVQLAERLGFHSVWTAEAYGSDALSPLAYLAALTTEIKLGTSVVQLAARTPAATAMAAMTIDALAGGGRTIIGIGVSGPQIVEGWYGRPWGSPNAQLRDYVAIMRKIINREGPVTHDGAAISLPYNGADSIGQGKPLKSILHPAGEIEIWIASGGPRNTALAAEVADGWLPMGFGPTGSEVYGPVIDEGFARRADGFERDRFDIFTGLSIEFTDDVAAAIAAKKPLTAMYVGGMGSESHNYHRDSMARRGYPEAAERIQELWLEGDKKAAVAAVPDEYIEDGALIGDEARIRSRWSEVVPAGITGMIIRSETERGLEIAAELSETEPRA